MYPFQIACIELVLYLVWPFSLNESLFVLRIFQCICFGTQLDDIAAEKTGFDFEDFVVHLFVMIGVGSGEL
jgi:hypothetical protein